MKQVSNCWIFREIPSQLKESRNGSGSGLSECFILR